MAGLIRFLLWTALVLGVVFGLLRLTAIRIWRIPANDPVLEASIAPTLRGGDLVVLQRLMDPAIGDLVVCPEPDYPDRFVIGRLIAEGGDTVQVKNGRFTVNGKGFRQERVCNPTTFTVLHPDNDSEIEQSCSWLEVANKVHMVGQIGANPFDPSEEETRVPPGQLYLASDNRLFPYDSRDYGPVERDSCKEVPALRLVSAQGWQDAEARFTYIH